MLFSRPAASSGANFGAWVVPATAETPGVAKRAATRPGSGRGRECGSWSHRLLSGEPTDEDHPPLLTVRTDHRLDRRHRLCIRRHKWRTDRLLWRIELGWRLELQHLPHPRGIVALRGMPQTEVSDLVEAARQHVLEEAAHELLAAEPARVDGCLNPPDSGDVMMKSRRRASRRARRGDAVTGGCDERRLTVLRTAGKRLLVPK